MVGQNTERDASRSDAELIREFRERRSEAAFGELVRRHVNLVFATAVRSVRDHALAEEISQNVFVALAKRAGSLAAENSIAGWMYQTTILESRQAIRAEVRRHHRQLAAAELGTTMKDDGTLPEAISEILDDALLALSEVDRKALVLRYFDDRSHREVGLALGAGEDAARKRIQKALDQLGEELRRRGYPTATAAVAASALSSAGAVTAPVNLAFACTQAGLASLGGASLLSQWGWRLMRLTKVQTTALCVAVVSLPTAVQWTSLRREQSEYRALQARWSSLTNELGGLTLTHQAAIASGNDSRHSLEMTHSSLRRQEQARTFAETNLYAWPAAGDFIRVPKSLLSSLQLCADYPGVRPPKSKAPDTETILSPQGEPSAILKEALRLTDAETRKWVELYGDLAGQFHDLAAENQTVTNGHPQSYSAGMPFAQTLVTEPFPEEGESIKQRFDALIAAELGSDRAKALNQQVENELQERFSNYGRWRHFETIFWDRDGNLSAGTGLMDPSTGNFRSSTVSGMPSPNKVDPALLALLPDEVLQKAFAKSIDHPEPSQP